MLTYHNLHSLRCPGMFLRGCLWVQHSGNIRRDSEPRVPARSRGAFAQPGTKHSRFYLAFLSVWAYFVRFASQIRSPFRGFPYCLDSYFSVTNGWFRARLWPRVTMSSTPTVSNRILKEGKSRGIAAILCPCTCTRNPHRSLGSGDGSERLLAFPGSGL